MELNARIFNIFLEKGAFWEGAGQSVGAAALERPGQAESGMQGWTIAWRYVGVWFPQRLCAEVYNPLRTTAGSWRRARTHTDIGGGVGVGWGGARLSSPPKVGRMLHMQDRSKSLTKAVGFS